MTFYELFRSGVEVLNAAESEDAEFDARELLLFAADLSAAEFLLRRGEQADEETVRKFTKLTLRRQSGEPLQYIIGKCDFYGNVFFVGNGVLIPRPETEQLTDICIDIIKKRNIKVVFDLCAGSGCIGISIAKACPQTTVYLFEKYEAAAYYCQKNIGASDLDNAFFVSADIFDGIPADLPEPQLIVSNPPYIPSIDISGLQAEVLREPLSALDGGADGLDFYHAIAEQWIACCKGLGYCAVECGEEQAAAIGEIFSPYGQSEIIRDIYGAERFVLFSAIT